MPAFLEELCRDDVQAAPINALQLEDDLPEDVQVAHVSSVHPKGYPQFHHQSRPPRQSHQHQIVSRTPSTSQPCQQCRLCKTESHHFGGHTMGSCKYISDGDKQDMVKSCRVEADSHGDDQLEEYYDEA